MRLWYLLIQAFGLSAPSAQRIIKVVLKKGKLTKNFSFCLNTFQKQYFTLLFADSRIRNQTNIRNSDSKLIPHKNNNPLLFPRACRIFCIFLLRPYIFNIYLRIYLINKISNKIIMLPKRIEIKITIHQFIFFSKKGGFFSFMVCSSLFFQ